jgi:hypothetical protein
LVAGFARVLARDGVLIVSSPDKRTYSEVSGFRNEFHVRELYREELLDLLQPHFPHVHLYGQKLLFQSALWSLDAVPSAGRAALATAMPNPAQDAKNPGSAGGLKSDLIESGLRYDPLYFIAVCSRQPLTGLPELALFGDREESVYQHYNHEVRKNMAAGARIAELEAENAALRSESDRLKQSAGT